MADKDGEEWSSDANEAIEIAICQPGADATKTLSRFHPRFTYPIFGDEERIFGYKALRIGLRFAAHDLYPNVAISYDKKFPSVGDTHATDILAILKEFLPTYAFEKSEKFKTRIQEDASAASFSPPGKLVEQYSVKGRQYEIWCAELTDPAVQLLLERMQIFISFFVEGGTPLELHDQDWTLARWRVFFVYEKLSSQPTPTASTYSIVGYSTSYRFLTYHNAHTEAKKHASTFTFPPEKPIPVASLPSRARVSQFLILPSHQGHSHGTHLYNTMAETFLADPACTEITVEDPNEQFDDLRDYCDYARLTANGMFAQIKLNTTLNSKITTKRPGARVPTSLLLDVPLLRKLRISNKLAPRQFDRLVEMYLLAQIPAHSRQAGTSRLTQRGKASDAGDRAYYYWRLLAKQRIYKKNRDVLAQLERPERVDKVEETVADLGADYERLIRGMESRRGEHEHASGNGSGEMVRRGKRKVVDDEDEDTDGNGNGEGEEVEEERGRKRRREDDQD